MMIEIFFSLSLSMSSALPEAAAHAAPITENWATSWSEQGGNAQVYLVGYSNSETVWRDRLAVGGGSAAYVSYPPVWVDRNGNGTANDWITNAAGDPFAGDIRSPICYVSGTRVTLAVVEVVVWPAYSIASGSMLQGAEAGAVGGATFTGSLQYISGSNGNAMRATMNGEGKTFTTIAADMTYSISWQVVTPTGQTAAGTTTNPLYWVLLSPPAAPPDESHPWALCYSLLDIGCRWAHGLGAQSAHQTIADAIFIEFQDKHVVRSTDTLELVANPEPLTYWKHWWFASFNVFASANDPGLLHGGDGRCEAWALFFIRCMHAVGIDVL